MVWFAGEGKWGERRSEAICGTRMTLKCSDWPESGEAILNRAFSGLLVHYGSIQGSGLSFSTASHEPFNHLTSSSKRKCIIKSPRLLSLARYMELISP